MRGIAYVATISCCIPSIRLDVIVAKIQGLGIPSMAMMNL